MAVTTLESLEDTAAFGQKLALALQKIGPIPVLMRGEMGAGKTTLCRFLASSLPGAKNAVISSPSFNICNRYPTSPEIVHCDLYRCRDDIPEEVENALFAPNIITIVEWSEWLPAEMLPANFLDIFLSVRNNAHLLKLSARGPLGAKILSSL